MKKIAIIGPESTGKSTLSEQLAEHYHTVYCPEIAREYLIGQGGQYNYEDLLQIARQQIAMEDKMLSEARNGVYIIDTNMFVMQVWCEVVYQNCHKWILQQIASRNYDLHLLCDVDLPWIADKLREYPDLDTRKKHFKMYEEAMFGSGGNWVKISGNSEERLSLAVKAIEKI